MIVDMLRTICGCCLPLQNCPVIKMNGSCFKIIKLLGEGGFSFVYLVEQELTRNGADRRNQYALKKIRCGGNGSTGISDGGGSASSASDAMAAALKEIENYKEFNSPYIVKLLDSSIVQEPSARVVYLLLPYFSEGTLQDVITRNVIRGEQIDEKEAVRIFIGICRGLQVMHRHKLNSKGVQKTVASSLVDNENTPFVIQDEDDDDEFDTDSQSGSVGVNVQETVIKNKLKTKKGGYSEVPRDADNTDTIDNYSDHEDVNTIDTSKIADFAEIAQALNNPTTTGKNNTNGNNNLLLLDNTELSETVPFAHCDLKPANVMLSRDGLPVLCDLGSCRVAKLHAKNRKQALQIQDMAAEHCTLPYRAPELLDVETGSTIDERIDIWSLGCVLYAMLYGSSPFEKIEADSGASISLAISTGKYNFPNDDIYSDDVKDLIKFCLVVDPKERPRVEDVLSKALALR